MMLLMMLLTATTAGAWEGQGNETSPYLIKTNDDLNQLATNVKNATNLYEGVYFRLENDLDYGGGSSTNYTPIGNDDYDHTSGAISTAMARPSAASASTATAVSI